MATVTLSHIRAARERIAGKVERTLTVLSTSLSEGLGVPVHLKLEHRQTTGSFKLRGAIAATGMEEAIGRPVVTSNQATAWNCLRLCGDETAHPEFGRLMTLPLPRD